MKYVLIAIVSFLGQPALACSVTALSAQTSELSALFSSKDVQNKIGHQNRITQIQVEQGAYLINTTGFCNLRAKAQYVIQPVADESVASCPILSGFSLEEICNNFRD